MIKNILHAEPTVFINLITAILIAATQLGLLTQNQNDTGVQVARIVVPLILIGLNAIFNRQAVFSPKTVSGLLGDKGLPPPGPPPSGNPPA